MNKLKSTYVSFLLVLFEKLQCLFIFWLKIYIMCHKTDHVKSLLEPCIITGQLLSSYFLHCASFRFVSSSAGLRLLLKEVCLVERRVHVSVCCCGALFVCDNLCNVYNHTKKIIIIRNIYTYKT